MMRLAIVDDDPEFGTWLAGVLRDAGHVAKRFTRPASFQESVHRDTFDMAILDSMTPGMGGTELLDWLRNTRIPAMPVIMVTERREPGDMVAAFEAGADDYVTKPVIPSVLLARVHALARRSLGPAPTAAPLTVGAITLDPAGRAWIYDEEVVLTAKEHQLALFLLSNIGRTLSRAHLLEAIWGKGPEPPTRTVDVHASRLRRKLRLGPEVGLTLSTIHGLGYRLEPLHDPQVATRPQAASQGPDTDHARGVRKHRKAGRGRA